MSKDNHTQDVSLLPSPSTMIEAFGATATHHETIQKARDTVRKILRGEDPRLLLIIGPCSIHDLAAAKEYAIRLKALAKEVQDNFFVLMRTYFEKPRTTVGWKGLLFDPHLDGSNDIKTGIALTRQFLLFLADQEIPAATEFLDPSSTHYFSDLISWGCIGSRTAESQTHRELASRMPLPVGFKNNTNGNVQIAVNGVLAAAEQHAMIGLNSQGEASILHTTGNPDCHIVLRGGDLNTNYDPESIASALNQLKNVDLPEAVIVDCSHGNSRREHRHQIAVFQSLIHQVTEGNSNIKGLIVESNLMEGEQNFPRNKDELIYGLSITDPCLGWNQSEQLVHWGNEKLRQHHEDPLTTSLHASPCNLL